MTINGSDIGRASVGTRNEIGQEQSINVMGDGSVRVRNTEPFEETLTWSLPRMTNAQWEGIKAIVRYAANFSGTPLTIVDDYGVSRSCRVWKESLRGESRLGRFWSAELTVRVEN
jgi:hypothetical protein